LSVICKFPKCDMQNRGLKGGRYRPLTDGEIRKVRDAAVTILEQTGFEVDDTEVRNLSKHPGACARNNRVTLTRAFFEDAVDRALHHRSENRQSAKNPPSRCFPPCEACGLSRQYPLLCHSRVPDRARQPTCRRQQVLPRNLQHDKTCAVGCVFARRHPKCHRNVRAHRGRRECTSKKADRFIHHKLDDKPAQIVSPGTPGIPGPVTDLHQNRTKTERMES